MEIDGATRSLRRSPRLRARARAEAEEGGGTGETVSVGVSLQPPPSTRRRSHSHGHTEADDSPSPSRSRSVSPKLIRLESNHLHNHACLADSDYCAKLHSLLPMLPEENQDTPIVNNVDLLKNENRTKHNTDGFADGRLIVRRGAAFELQVKFGGNFDRRQHSIVLQFAYGEKPSQSQQTLVRLGPVEFKNGSKITDPSLWEAELKGITGSDFCRFIIRPSAETAVGEWSLFVEIVDLDSHPLSRYLHLEDIVLLFNPWSHDDQVYCESNESRDEYILAESGIIFVGNKLYSHPLPWNYGQFEAPILSTALYLMNTSYLQDGEKSNVIRVVRALSSMVNFNDKDGGVLVGRWTQTYPKNCTRPTAWGGSVEICAKFARKNYMVKYGQCWVFAGVLCSGIFQTGPASVAAVREGEVYLPYDTGFVYAEVNGDRIHWRVSDDGREEVELVDRHAVGFNISTKTPGADLRLDLTQQYKYPEGSEKERLTNCRAVRFGSRSHHENPICAVGSHGQLRLSIRQPSQPIIIGKSVRLSLDLKSQSAQRLRVNLSLAVRAVHYTGKTEAVIMDENWSLQLSPNHDLTTPVLIGPARYLKQLEKCACELSLKCFARANVEQTGEIAFAQEIFDFAKPNIEIELVPALPKVGQPVRVTLRMVNPLPTPLKAAEFHFEGLADQEEGYHEWHLR